MTEDFDRPRFNIAEAAKRVGANAGGFRAWLTRSPDHGLGTVCGRARLFSKRDLYILALAASAIRYGAGPPSAAIAAAKRIAAMPSRHTVFVHRDRHGLHVEHDLAHRPAIAIPAGEIWQRIAEI